MKKNYTEPQIEVIRFDTKEVLNDVLIESSYGNKDYGTAGGVDIFGGGSASGL